MTESVSFDLFSSLKSFSDSKGLALDEFSLEKLKAFWAMVKSAAQHQDLTRILEDDAAYSKHFLDSYAPFYLSDKQNYFGEGEYCLDIGTGAGFPGVLLSFLAPEKKWVLVDSRLKKIQFLEKVKEELKLKNLFPFHGRAEELTKLKPDMVKNVCFVTSRAIKLDLKIQKEVFRLMADKGFLIQYVGPSAEVIEFPKGHEIGFLRDENLELHEDIKNHRLLIYQK